MEEIDLPVPPSPALTASSVDIVLEAELRPGCISAHFDPTEQRPSTAAIDARIASQWDAAERDAAAHNRLLFPGPLVRVLRYESRPGRLDFWLGPTDYREYIGTRGLEDAAFRAEPLAACAAVRTADGKILVGRRGKRIMESVGWWHLIAGYVDPILDCGGEDIDVFHTILREVEEELGFPRAEASAVCLGLVRWRVTHKPELLFAVDTPRTSRDLRLINDEHDEIRAIDDRPRAIQEFLEEAGACIAGPALACLVRYTAWRHGAAL